MLTSWGWALLENPPVVSLLKTSQHFMEAEGGSLPSSQMVTILSQINPVCTPFHFLEDPFLYYPPSYILVFLVVSFLPTFPPISHTHFTSLHSCYIHFTSRPPWRDRSNFTWPKVQAMKLLTVQFSSLSLYLSTVQIFPSATCFQTPSVFVTYVEYFNFKCVQKNCQMHHLTQIFLPDERFQNLNYTHSIPVCHLILTINSAADFCNIGVAFSVR
jgi:hypothetical protein